MQAKTRAAVIGAPAALLLGLGAVLSAHSLADGSPTPASSHSAPAPSLPTGVTYHSRPATQPQCTNHVYTGRLPSATSTGVGSVVLPGGEWAGWPAGLQKVCTAY